MNINEITKDQLESTYLGVTQIPGDGAEVGAFARDVVKNAPRVQFGLKIFNLFEPDPIGASTMAFAAGLRIGLALAAQSQPEEPVVADQAVS